MVTYGGQAFKTKVVDDSEEPAYNEDIISCVLSVCVYLILGGRGVVCLYVCVRWVWEVGCVYVDMYVDGRGMGLTRLFILHINNIMLHIFGVNPQT